jgi:hypothetical protein
LIAARKRKATSEHVEICNSNRSTFKFKVSRRYSAGLSDVTVVWDVSFIKSNLHYALCPVREPLIFNIVHNSMTYTRYAKCDEAHKCLVKIDVAKRVS